MAAYMIWGNTYCKL